MRKAQIRYLLQDKQIKSPPMLVFAVRSGWDLLVRRPLVPNGENIPFQSHGDLLQLGVLAWSCHLAQKRDLLSYNFFDLRSRLKNTFTPGTSYLQNLILMASVLLPALDFWTTFFGQKALRSRQAIVEQATDM